MSDLTLVIGNKNYSSWSMRPWLAMKHIGVPFDEIVIPLYEEASKSMILRHSPSGKVPVLKHGRRTIWESLAILEYLAELFPEARLWPEDVDARAVARSASAEMHAGFQALRASMPMNVRASRPGRGRAPEVEADIRRIAEIWHDCRTRFGSDGPFLFGRFTNADAMFAPVVTRFNTYGVALDDVCRAYINAVLAWPAVVEWFEAAKVEPWRIERCDSV